MPNIIGDYTVTIGVKVKHQIRNVIKKYIAELILKPIGFVCRHFLKFDFEVYVVNESDNVKKGIK